MAFDPFFCGRDAGRGIGLGLPKALRLIESNGGRLAIDSRPGKGTRVVVTLAEVGGGTAIGVSAGTATISATASGFTATASVTVTAIPPGIVRLELSPTSGTLTVGGTQAVTVTAVFSDTTRQDVTAQATISSTAPSVASVSGTAIGAWGP